MVGVSFFMVLTRGTLARGLLAIISEFLLLPILIIDWFI
jgi:hypothetical protein